MRFGGTAAPSGELTMRAFRAPGPGARGFLTHALPRPGLPAEVNRWRLRQLPRLLAHAARIGAATLLGRVCGIATIHGRLSLRVTRGDGTILDYGLASYRVVTTAGVNAIVDAFQNTVELENFKYHGFGTGSTAEAIGDTALVTELTTEYATDNTRPTGSQTENGANVYRTVATLDPDADVNLREHGIFTQAATGGGTLLDRSLFASINLSGAGGDTLQATYDLTVTAGS